MLRAGVGYALAEDKLGARAAARQIRGQDGGRAGRPRLRCGHRRARPEQPRSSARWRGIVGSGDTLSGFLRDLKARYPEMQGVMPERGARSRPPTRRSPKADPEPTGSIRQKTHRRCAIGCSAAVVIRASVPAAVALHQRARDQAPAVHQHEEDQLERQRHHDRRQHHHAHRHQHRRHHEVDDQERQEQQKADLEGALQLRDHEGRNENPQRHLLRASPAPAPWRDR